MKGAITGRVAAFAIVGAALAAIPASAQTQSECQKYAVGRCAADKYVALGYPDRGSCYAGERMICLNGGVITSLDFRVSPALRSEMLPG